MHYPKMVLSAEVTEALHEERPVVALESTIIAHGMPYPRNLETAMRLEAIVREEGAVPATIAVLNGIARIGLEAKDLELLADPTSEVLKLSTRDLPYALASQCHGATTVAATMALAHRAGIDVFVTGGIGGVHRGAGHTFDISADLLELSRTPMLVVCAGAKSILDLPATLEVLESSGVPVLGYQTDAFPAFYCRDSGLKVDWVLSCPEQVAAFWHAKQDLKLPGAALLANPIPEAAALDASEMEAVIADTLAAAEREGVKGKAVTPYLLARVVKHTQGRSLEANIALVENNARVGARVATSM
ncbi:MAG: pseudouridine-5'-phosphate glycosidase [Chlamydiia bacterium]|nr:pseudouridine-5'-phosphate glycosidase [Chlamydiia bacterium]